MNEKLYGLRFELLLFSQLAILFGPLIFQGSLFTLVLDPVLFLMNLAVGMLLLSKRRGLLWFGGTLLIINGIIFGMINFRPDYSKTLDFIRLGSYFLFYLAVTFEIIRQIWHAAEVNKNVIIGLISGFIALGLIGFFVCLSIEMVHPGSFQGILLGAQVSQEMLTSQLMYFSFITLLTIGYGDIAPVTELAQKAAMLIGLMGQFYLVIITAVVVGKFVNQRMGQ